MSDAMILETAAVWFAHALALYLGAGTLIAVPIVVRGLERVDGAARGASWGFRLIVMPASVALWPWLLRRWWRGVGEVPVEINAHRRGLETGREARG